VCYLEMSNLGKGTSSMSLCHAQHPEFTQNNHMLIENVKEIHIMEHIQNFNTFHIPKKIPTQGTYILLKTFLLI